MHYHQYHLYMLHINSLETSHTPKDMLLEMDTAQDSQFFNTIHSKTNSSQTTARVKIDTGVQACTIPLIHLKRCLPTKSTATAPSPKMHCWLLPDILGTNNAGRSCPTRFYIFKDTTSPLILISYAVSSRLGILYFKLPNKIHQHKETLLQHS